MKFFIMFGSIIAAIIYGIYPKINIAKPLWWKIIAIFLVALSLILTIYPPIAGNTHDAIYLKKGIYKDINIAIKVNQSKLQYDLNYKYWQMVIGNESKSNDEFENLDYNNKLIIPIYKLPKEFIDGNKLVVNVSLDSINNALKYNRTIAINPIIEYPFVANLGERMKILNLHVPLSWIAVIAFLMSMMYAIKYLKSKEMIWDNYTSTTASLGTLYAILATITGMMWAKYNWGSYWNWDPRQTSILVLIMIYIAYFALRSAIENEEKRAKLSAVYSIISFITVPFLIFIVPRLSSGLHPGSADDSNSGPLVSQQPSSLDTTLIYGFGLAILSFTIIYFWILNVIVRYKQVSYNNEGQI